MNTTKNELETLRLATENLTNAYIHLLQEEGEEKARPVKTLLETTYAEFQKILSQNNH